jgi:hypothetical protein
MVAEVVRSKCSKMPFLHRETSGVHKREKLRLIALVEHNATGIHLRHRDVGHFVHHLMYQSMQLAAVI